MRRNSHETSFGGIIARLLMSFSAFLLLLSYASMVVNPAKAWYMTVFGLLFVPIAILNGIFLVIAIRKGSSSFMIPLLALLPSVIFIGRYFQFSSGAEEKGSETVRILSYNVGHFALGKAPEFKEDGGRAVCADSVVKFILDSDADIVCLQEVNLPGEYDVARFFEKRFPSYNIGYFMYVTDKGSYGNVTLSRFPVERKGKLMFDKSSNLAIFTDLKIGEGSVIRVYNCHFESYNVSLARLKKSVTDKDGELMWETEEKMKKSIRRRPEQVDKVMSDIEDCTLEAIVTGDFNDNPMSYTYNRLKKGRDDSFVEAGKGFGATYSFLWPFIRIDYILYPSHFSAVSHTVPRIRYSDHYPVIAEINLK